jgi:superfamily I DNA and/or RNA helicase
MQKPTPTANAYSPHPCAGDHLQLPPTVLSDAAAKAGLSCTLFERLQHRLGADASCMLSVQYRMHADIMDWSSQELYEVGGLICL